MQNIPLFGSSASKISPPSITVTSGYFPLQYLPAENLNYYLNGATQAIQEWVNLITLAGLSPSTSQQGWAAISGLIAIRPLSFFTGLIAGATGAGQLVLATGPALLHPTVDTLNGLGITATVSGILTIASNKTLSASQNAVFQGAAGATMDLPAIVASQLQGLLMTYVSTTSFSVATGSIGDSTFVNTLSLLATTTKTTSGWSVGSGNGGLDTGAIAANTWYAVYLIKRTDTNVVDVIYSTNGTSPSLPANYTLFRRIGWILTNGSSQLVQFFQIGRTFWWSTKFSELNAVSIANTTRNLVTVRVPKSTVGIFLAALTANNVFVDMGPTAATDVAASATNFVFGANSSGPIVSTQAQFPVDASNQIFYRASVATGTIYLMTSGWIDNL